MWSATFDGVVFRFPPIIILLAMLRSLFYRLLGIAKQRSGSDSAILDRINCGVRRRFRLIRLFETLFFVAPLGRLGVIALPWRELP